MTKDEKTSKENNIDIADILNKMVKADVDSGCYAKIMSEDSPVWKNILERRDKQINEYLEKHDTTIDKLSEDSLNTLRSVHDRVEIETDTGIQIMSEQWVPNMDKYLGRKGEINYIAVASCCSMEVPEKIQVQFSDGSRYQFLPTWISDIWDKDGNHIYSVEDNSKDSEVKDVALDDIGNTSETPIEKYIREFSERFPGREDAAYVATLGVLSGYPTFFLGPPGTAKSMILTNIAESMGLSKFEKLITEYTLPEELFGPIDIPSMKKGIWKRITEGFLPDANIVFLDEIFKSTTILNTLLRVMNEKIFKNGKDTIHIPLYAFFAASNEIPSDPSLLALYDRFVLRVVTDTLSDVFTINRMKKVSMDPNWSPPKFPEDLDEVRKKINDIKLSDEIINLATELETKIAIKGVVISNRKQVQTLNVMKASAYIHGRDEVTLYDFHVMKYIYWNVIEDIPVIDKLISTEVTPTLAALKEVKIKVSQDISDYGEKLKKNLQYQTMLWRTSKTLLERLPEPKSKEEREVAIKEILNFLDMLDSFTPTLPQKPKPRLKW